MEIDGLEIDGAEIRRLIDKEAIRDGIAALHPRA